MSPVLVKRAVSEDPRWTRVVGDHLARPQGSDEKAVCSMKPATYPAVVIFYLPCYKARPLVVKLICN